MSCNIGDDKNLFLELKSNMGLYHVVLTTTKTSLKKLTLTVVDMQQLRSIELTASKEKLFSLNRTISNGRRKLCVNFKTHTGKLNTVVYRYQKNLYLKDNEIDLELTKDQSLLAKCVHFLSCFVIISNRCIVLDESTVHT